MQQLWSRFRHNFAYNILGSPIEKQNMDVTNSLKKQDILKNIAQIRSIKEQLINAANTLIIALDTQGSIKLFNKAAEQLTGYKSKDVLNKPWLEVFIPRRWCGKIVDLHKDIFAGKVITHFEYPIFSKDKKEMDILWQYDLLIKKGKIIGAIAFGIDISDAKKAGQQAFQEKMLTDSIIENIPAGVAFLDNHFILRKFNTAYAKMISLYTPYNPKEALGKSYFQYTPGSRPQLEEWLIHVRDSGKSEFFPNSKLEITAGKKKKITYWNTSVVPVIDTAGKSKGIVILCVDITEKEIYELELTKAKKLNDAILAKIPGIFYLIDADGHLIHWNKFAETLTGYSPEKLTKIKARNIFVPRDRLLITSKMQECFTKGAAVCDASILTISGKEIPCYFDANQVLIDNQSFILGIGIDLTERKKSEQAITESRQRYVDLVDNLTVGVFKHTSGKAGIWLEINPAMVNIFQATTAQNLLNNPVKDIFINASDRLKYNQKLCTNGYLKGEEIRLKTISGRLFWGSITATVKKDETGRTYFYGTIEDITERKAAEEELIKYRSHLEEIVKDRTFKLENAMASLQLAKKDAETSNRAKSTFLASMSHEIRTPLNAVLGYAQLMLRDPTIQNSHREYIKIISHSGDHLLALINDVLEISKIEAGYAALNEGDFGFTALIHDVETMFRARANEKHLQFEVLTENNVPAFIRADAGKLRQVIINLISNAIKFTDHGGVIIRISRKLNNLENNLKSDQNKICIEVEDSGIGINKSELGHVFNSFRENNNVQVKGKGAGLGLAISLHYAKMMSGDITVTSELGKGSIFRFEFVAKSSAISTYEKVTTDTKRVVSLSPGSIAPKILVVDDEIESRNILKLLLTQVGFIIELATNGKDAIELANKIHPDLILMDIIMPEIDGIETTKILRSSQNGKNIPVVIITASPFEEQHQNAIMAGANGFIRKPFAETEIFEEIRKILHLTYVYEETAASQDLTQTCSEPITDQEIQKLPPPLLAEIIAAAELGQSSKIQKIIITNIAPLDSKLSAKLQKILDNYDYEKITCFKRATDTDALA